MDAAVKQQDLEGSAQQFKQWCAVIEMGCRMIGPRMIPIIAKQARENFGLSLLWQRTPEARIEVLARGETRNSFEGEFAKAAFEEIDKVQAYYEASGLAYSRDDIMLASIIRAVAQEELAKDEGE